MIYCCLIIRNADALLVEIKSRDRQYKRILVLRPGHGCNECKQCIFTSYCIAESLRLKSGMIKNTVQSVLLVISLKMLKWFV